MSRLDEDPLALVKLLIFMVVTALATGVLAIVIGNLSFGATHTYSAEFTDATGLVKGDDVRIAGVKVGSVKGVSIVHRTRALVTFDVSTSTSLTRATHADIRYRNLVGQRYVALTDEIGSTDRLLPGDTIPLARTSPALDLTVLFNGFKPLFQALSPADVNQLSYEIIQVFQGQGGTLNGMLAHTASITQTLADRDQVIGQLVTNLNSVLDHVGRRTISSTADHDVPALRRRAEGTTAARSWGRSTRSRGSRCRPPTWSPASARPFVSDIHHLRGFAANLDRGPGRDRPGAPGAADQADQDRPDRHLRLVVQLLPLQLHRPGADRLDRRPGQLRHQLDRCHLK